MKSTISLILKGMAMGAANVIPGVSGGTIAFITGIYSELIHSIKSFDLTAIKLAMGFKIQEFIEHVSLYFILKVFVGVAISIFSLAKLLEFVFINYSVQTMSFFFGLIFASVFLVGKQVKNWNATPILTFVFGSAIAIGIAFLNPATANDSFFYLFLCGIVAICSMILPGLSGSYVLLVMGNYLLILEAVGDLNITVLLPVIIGSAFGLVAFSHLISFIFDNYWDAAVGLLAGFVFGSLLIIWPWKTEKCLLDAAGECMTKDDGELIIAGYEWSLPAFDGTLLVPLVMIVLGAAIVFAIERMGSEKEA